MLEVLITIQLHVFLPTTLTRNRRGKPILMGRKTCPRQRPLLNCGWKLITTDTIKEVRSTLCRHQDLLEMPAQR